MSNKILYILLCFTFILISCTNKEVPKKEVVKEMEIILTCTGIQESITDSTRPDSPNLQDKINKTILYKLKMLPKLSNEVVTLQWYIQVDGDSFETTSNTKSDLLSSNSILEVSDQKIKFYSTLTSNIPQSYTHESIYHLNINRYTGEFSLKKYYIFNYKDKTYVKTNENTIGRCEKSVQKI